jgi:HIRAN domain
MADAVPPHLTRRISLTKLQLRTELGAELLSLCESITAYGNLEPEERDALHQWLDDSNAVDLPAASYLREIVEKVLAIGKMKPDECREVYRVIETVLPPQVRRGAHAARREVEARSRERSAEERERHRPIESANFMVAGVRHGNRPAIIARFAKADQAVRLVRDRDSEYGSNAIAVCLENGMPIGFVPEDHSTLLAPLLDEGASYQASITRILTGGRSPIPVVEARLYRSDAVGEANSAETRVTIPMHAHRDTESVTAPNDQTPPQIDAQPGRRRSNAPLIMLGLVILAIILFLRLRAY